VTAVPDEGYELSSWLLDGSYAGSSNNITITMNSNHCIQAVFSTVVPEFPTAVPLVIFFVAALFLALLYKKTGKSKKPTPRP
jgi:preprotein translocase subunit SecG